MTRHPHITSNGAYKKVRLGAFHTPWQSAMSRIDPTTQECLISKSFQMTRTSTTLI